MSLEYPCIYFENQKCKKFEEPGYTSWCVYGPCSHQVESNADRIRVMSDQEIAEFLCNLFGDTCCDSSDEACYCPGYELCNNMDGKANGLLKWLKQPAKEEH